MSPCPSQCRLTDHRGWSGGRPGPANWPGIVFVAAGAGLIAWAIVSPFRASADEVRFTARPDELVTAGAYAHTRNPLYLGGALLWLGWAVLLGSLSVAIGAIALFTGIALVAVPMEEVMLSRQFGDTYEAHRRKVPGLWSTRPRRNR